MRPFDTTGAFDPAIPLRGTTLRRIALRGAGATVLSGVISLAIQVVATVVLARLLAPRDFGLVAMITTFSLLLSNFGINGITEAIVQRERVDQTLAGNLFWIAVGGGMLLTCGFAAAASVLARFYHESLVAPVAAGISISILLSSLSVVHLALLKRAMCFSAVAKSDIVAKAVSVIVSIVCGYAGWGYRALVMGVCAMSLSTAVGAWLLCRWIPGRPRRAYGTAESAKFAMYTYGRFSVNYFARNADNLLVGWRFGALALGFYKKAYDLFSLSASQLVSSTSVVAISALSRLKNDRAQFQRYLLSAMGVIAFLGMGISADLTLVGKDVIRVLLGPGWEESGRIFIWFAPGIGAMMLYGMHGWIHLSIGRADRWFRWGILEWSVTILLFLAALRWGPRGIAAAWCLSFWILAVPALSYAGKPIGVEIKPMLGIVWRYIVSALSAGIVTQSFANAIGLGSDTLNAREAALRAGIISICFSGCYLGLLALLHRGFAPLRNFVDLFREMAGAGKERELFTAGKIEVGTLSVLAFAAVLVGGSVSLHAQPWSPIIGSNRAIDWSSAGAGGIPPRSKHCADLTPRATLDQINAALSACPAGETVFLAPGTYTIPGTVRIPSNVTLRGAGPSLTILNAVGTSGGDVISLGSGSVSYLPIPITSKAGAGSRNIEVGSASEIQSGMYLVIAEKNDPLFVSSMGSGGNCNWCDGWTESGSLARGQIVKVTSVRGTTIAFSPVLYSDYRNSPIAVPFNMSAQQAGVEDLQVYGNNTGYSANFGLSRCAFCWVKAVESNYTDGDHVEIKWGFHDEIRDSYFSNAYLHVPGEHDSDIQIAFKTSASLVENNIIERTHVAVMLEWGAAGNVVAYNYTTGEFDSGAQNLVIGGIDFHGAHPQFNLLEGNVVSQIVEDSVWGTSSHTTAFRNWVVGTNRVCGLAAGRSVSCAARNSHFGFQAARAVEVSYLGSANNFVANVVGSAQMQSLRGYNYPLRQIDSVEYPAPRGYDTVAYGWSFGYGSTSDDGAGSGCGGGTPPCHEPGVASSNLLVENYSNIAGKVLSIGRTIHLPPSFYLRSRPRWWGSLAFPAIGPDVAGGPGPGGHSYGNPARACYLGAMGGVDGGQGIPRAFEPDKCYEARKELSPIMLKSSTGRSVMKSQATIESKHVGEVQ